MGKQFLGRGWPFPVDIGFDGRVAYASEEAKIQQSVLLILGTAKGERMMRPDFGSRLSELVFAPINSNTKGLVSMYVTEALVQWEARVDVLRVRVREEAASPGALMVDLEYRVRSTNSVFNLVYPFYLATGKV